MRNLLRKGTFLSGGKPEKGHVRDQGERRLSKEKVVKERHTIDDHVVSQRGLIKTIIKSMIKAYVLHIWTLRTMEIGTQAVKVFT